MIVLDVQYWSVFCTLCLLLGCNDTQSPKDGVPETKDKKLNSKSPLMITASDVSSVDRLKDVFADAGMLRKAAPGFKGPIHVEHNGFPCWADFLQEGKLIRLRLPIGNDKWNQLHRGEQFLRANQINREATMLRVSLADDGILECSCVLPVYDGIPRAAIIAPTRSFIEELAQVSASKLVSEE